MFLADTGRWHMRFRLTHRVRRVIFSSVSRYDHLLTAAPRALTVAEKFRTADELHVYGVAMMRAKLASQSLSPNEVEEQLREWLSAPPSLGVGQRFR